MGFWDGGLDDLTSVNVQVTATEERVLDQGGSVMYLNPLLDPMSVFEGANYGALQDVEGQDIFVPWRITVVSPTDSYTPSWKPGDGQKIWQQIDAEQGTDWRRFPAYIGLLDEESAEMTSAGYGIEYHWIEMLRPYRFWSCVPIVSDEDKRAVKALEKACNKMLTESCYLDLMWALSEEHSGEILLEDIVVAFGVVKAPKPESMSQTDWKVFKSSIRDQARDYYGADDQACIQRGIEYAHLVEKGLFRWSWEDVPPSGWKDLEIKPMLDFLEPGEQYAADFWERAITKRAVSKAMVESSYFRDISKLRSFQYQENQIA